MFKIPNHSLKKLYKNVVIVKTLPCITYVVAPEKIFSYKISYLVINKVMPQIVLERV
jgi:hypothetical protein